MNKGFNVNNMVLSTDAGVQLIDAKLALTDHFYPTTADGFAPKIGFAWQPLINGSHMVVHGGIGMSLDNLDEEPISPAY